MGEERERKRRGSGEEGITFWGVRQQKTKKERANNIASLVVVGKAKEKKIVT